MAPRRKRGGADYAGARGLLTLDDAAKLGPRWALQGKIDGAYAVVVLDAQGHPAEVLSRSGRPYSPTIHQLADAGQVGAPWSILVGELEAHTEPGRRAAERRGFPLVHAFDAIQIGRRRVAELPYRERRDALMRMHAALAESQGTGRPWRDDDHGRAHDLRTGRFRDRRPVGWRRVVPVEQHSPSRLDELWADVERRDLEGLVAVNLDAPLGRRGAKRKIKRAATHDAVVVRVEGRRIGCLWANSFRLTMGSGGNRLERPLRVGDIVEFRCNGYYDSGEPRHPRVVRLRSDLA